MHRFIATASFFLSFSLLAFDLPTGVISGELTLSKKWVLKSDGHTMGDKTVQLSADLEGTTPVTQIVVHMDGKLVSMVRADEGINLIDIPVSRLSVGKHQVTVDILGGEGSRDVLTLNVSYPLYVIVSTDWDDTRAEDVVFDYIDQLHLKFPDMRITHFFAPYHYTDPKLSHARKRFVHRFMRRMHEVEGDEIGLHIHGWCHFINTLSVDCRTEESFSRDDGTGYTTILAAYEQFEMERILRGSIRMFERKGLPRPTSFRAGGWTADEKVLAALANTGFVVDTSSVPAHRLSSWQGFPLFDWNMENWKGITETSQPYYPSETNAAKTGYPHIPILEVPDNGVLVDYVSAKEMKDIFDLNYPEHKPLKKPTMYQIGFHPVDSFLYGERMDAMEEALNYTESHSYVKDNGPVVYANISDLTKVFKL